MKSFNGPLLSVNLLMLLDIQISRGRSQSVTDFLNITTMLFLLASLVALYSSFREYNRVITISEGQS